MGWGWGGAKKKEKKKKRKKEKKKKRKTTTKTLSANTAGVCRALGGLLWWDLEGGQQKTNTRKHIKYP